MSGSRAPVLAVVAVGFVSLGLGEGEPHEYRPRMLLSTFDTGLPEETVGRPDEDRPVPRASGAAP